MLRLSSLALKNLGIRKGRTFLTTIGVALGVAVILATSIANRSTIGSFEAMIDSIAGRADFWINGASPEGFAEKELEVVRRVKGVSLAVPGISRRSTLIAGDEREDVEVAGIDPGVDRRLRHYALERGRFIRRGGAAEVVIPTELARSRDLELRGTVEIAHGGESTKFTIVGLLKDEGAGRGGLALFTNRSTGAFRNVRFDTKAREIRSNWPPSCTEGK